MDNRTPLRVKITLILFGIFLSLVLVEAALRLAGGILTYAQEQGNRASLLKKNTVRILCLGESTTVGRFAWPRHLEEMLNAAGSGKTFNVVNKGVAGVDTSYIVSQLAANLDEYQPDIVVVMMGINDRAGHMPVKVVGGGPLEAAVRRLKIYKLLRFLQLHLEATMSRSSPRAHAASGQLLLKADPQLAQYQQALKNNPRDEKAYLQLGAWYKDHGWDDEAEAVFAQLLSLAPRQAAAYTQLGWIYRSRGQYAQAEAAFKKAITLAPQELWAYRGLRWVYQDQTKFDEAEAFFRGLIQDNPANALAYTGLGALYKAQFKKMEEAGQALRKAIELEPDNAEALLLLGDSYRWLGHYELAEPLLQQAIKLEPHHYEPYDYLGWIYLRQRRYDEARQLFSRFLTYEPEDIKAHAALVFLYEQTGDQQRRDEWQRKMRALPSLSDYDPLGRGNYEQLRRAVTRRGLILVCIQYPMRPLKSLKQIFDDPAGIIFVDNERSFREAVAGEGYRYYFNDIFAGDFGHCTKKGNRLLAKNVAEAILKEYFSLPPSPRR